MQLASYSTQGGCSGFIYNTQLSYYSILVSLEYESLTVNFFAWTDVVSQQFIHAYVI